MDTRGDRTLGTVGGAVAGALLGREVERGTDRRRCR
ncbi:glycine zipper 2TM domain-containing protein [Sphingomonas jejuensis]